MDTIPALVFTLIDVTLLIKLLKNVLDNSLVPRFGCPDEIVVRDGEPLPKPFPGNYHLVHVFLDRHLVPLGGSGDFLSMLVCPGKEKNVLTA
jgi:hypothetical protein